MNHITHCDEELLTRTTNITTSAPSEWVYFTANQAKCTARNAPILVYKYLPFS